MSAHASLLPNLSSSLVKLPEARRAPPQTLVAEIQTVSGSPVVSALLEAVDGALLVLNAQRQIVASNARSVCVGDPGQALGKRPGEALGCVNAQGEGGCGAAPACLHCGALSAIVACHVEGRPAEAECLLRADAGDAGSLELNVRATPVSIDGHRFTVVSLRDVSAEKRRDALEQVFLHDVLNTVAALRGWVSRLGSADPARAAGRVDRVSLQLEREIRDHRALVEAERGTLLVDLVRVAAADALADAEVVLASHACARTRRLEVIPAAPGLAVQADRALLRRVLVNMGANALEATPEGGTVTVSCALDGARVVFRVANPGVMPPAVQAGIFRRSFSTKARHGRGLGTWSMKLLGERFLRGEVAFTSTAADGTAFTLALPRA